MAFETISIENKAGNHPESESNCLNFLGVTNNGAVKDFVGFVKNNFKTFDLDKSGSISVPELESVIRNPATTATNRQAASFMINHFDQMANYVKGDDSISDQDFEFKEGVKSDYRDLKSLAAESTTNDITITARDIDVMSFTATPEERARLERNLKKGQIGTLIFNTVGAAPLALTIGVVAAPATLVAGGLTAGTLYGIGAGEAIASAAGLAVTGVLEVAVVAGVAGLMAYESYQAFTSGPSTAAIENAYKQRQAMLDSWVCKKLSR